MIDDRTERQHAGTRVKSILDGANATPKRGSRMAGKLPAALAIASEGARTLIGASLNKLVFLGDLAEPSTPYAGGVRLRR